MKTEFNNSKDNFTGVVLATILLATAATLFTGNRAHANPPAINAAQKMDTVVVTGSRNADQVLDTLVVTAARLKKTQA